jgi:hypothetical protein
LKDILGEIPTLDEQKLTELMVDNQNVIKLFEKLILHDEINILQLDIISLQRKS